MARAKTQLSLFPELPKQRNSSGGTRLFFALWPDRTTREAIAARAAQVPPGCAVRARWVRAERLHMTLSFFAALSAQQVDAAKRAGSMVQAKCFRLELDAMGHFPASRSAWFGPRELPRGLGQLKAALDRELLRFGLPVEAGPFRPHVTVIRGLDEAPEAPPSPIEWSVEEFVLLRSRLRPGVSDYKLVARWPLQAVGGG